MAPIWVIGPRKVYARAQFQVKGRGGGDCFQSGDGLDWRSQDRNIGRRQVAQQSHPATKDRRDIGEVIFLSEKMAAARELNSCCIGVEAALEGDTRLTHLLKSLLRVKPDQSSG